MGFPSGPFIAPDMRGGVHGGAGGWGWDLGGCVGGSYSWSGKVKIGSHGTHPTKQFECKGVADRNANTPLQMHLLVPPPELPHPAKDLWGSPFVSHLAGPPRVPKTAALWGPSRGSSNHTPCRTHAPVKNAMIWILQCLQAGGRFQAGTAAQYQLPAHSQPTRRFISAPHK